MFCGQEKTGVNAFRKGGFSGGGRTSDSGQWAKALLAPPQAGRNSLYPE
jgi:hypothetical protein